MRRESRFAEGAGCLAAVIAFAAAVFGGARMASADSCPALVFQPATDSTLPSATVGGSYSELIKVVSGATPPVTFTSSPSAPLPQGLHLVPTSNDNSAAIIVGSPTEGGIRTFIIDAAASVGCTGFGAYSINILGGNACNPPPTRSPPGGSLQPVKSTDSLTGAIRVGSGAADPFTVDTSGGPEGLSVYQGSPESGPSAGDLNVSVLGVPPGTYTFQVTVTDARGCKATGTYT